MGKFFKKHWTTILLIVILSAGLCLLLYPTVSDEWNKYHQSRAVASYIEAVADTSEEEKEAMLAAAREYNARLTEKGIHFILTDEEKEEYNSLLDLTGTGIMGYIQIPSIDVRFPIYHGTDEAVLQIAIGHLEGASLPIGGAGTHAALSGHRGLPSARLFTDLDKLVEGDVFMITVLDETITYMVNQIRIVLPEEVDNLKIDPEEDYCTLITCTPYGVNTHRILVRGTRIENLSGELAITAEARKIPSYIVMFAIGIPMLFILLIIMLVYYRAKGPVKSSAEMIEEMKNQNRQQEPEDNQEKSDETS